MPGKITKLAVPGLVGMLLAACSGGSSKSNSSGSSSGSGGYPTAKAVIEQLQSKGLTCVSQQDQSGQLYSKDGWECDTTRDGGSVTAYIFSDDSNRDQWLKVARTFGGNYVIGDKWIVDTDTPTLATTVQADIGGKIK